MEAILGRSGNYAAILLKSSAAFGSLFSSSHHRCLCLYDPRKWNNILHGNQINYYICIMNIIFTIIILSTY